MGLSKSFFCLLILIGCQLSAAAPPNFLAVKDQGECSSLLDSNIQRWTGDSKYVYPKDWNFVQDKDWDASKAECEKYGLELPSPHNIKDWLSLQNLTRNYISFAIEYHKKNPTDGETNLDGTHGSSPYNLGFNRLNKAIKWKDDSGKDPFMIWDPRYKEPNNDGEQNAAAARVRAVKYQADKAPEYFLSSGDVTSLSASYGGRLVCQYPPSSICHQKSQEEIDYEAYKSTEKKLKYLGATLKGMWWMTTFPRGRGPAAEECQTVMDSTNPRNKMLWEGDASIFSEETRQSNLNQLRDLTIKGFIELGLHPNSGFTGKGPMGSFRWETNDGAKDLFGNDAQIREIPHEKNPFPPPYLSLCLYEFKEGESMFDNIQVKDQADCGRLLHSDLKQWEDDSKYVFPQNWDLVKGKSWEEMKMICQNYGLQLPSTYNIKDWLSLQDITRNFIEFAKDTKLDVRGSGTIKVNHPFSLGDNFLDGKNWRDVNNKTDLYTIWQTRYGVEPNQDNELVANVRLQPVKYIVDIKTNETMEEFFISAGDIRVNTISYGGYLLCMYPKRSICSKESGEDKAYKEFENAAPSLKFLGMTKNGWWWLSSTPKLRSDAIEDCKKGDPEIPWVKMTLFEGNGTQLGMTKYEVDNMRQLVTKGLLGLGLNPVASFVSRAAYTWNWDSNNVLWKKPKISINKHSKELSPYLFICFSQLELDKSCEKR